MNLRSLWKTSGIASVLMFAFVFGLAIFGAVPVHAWHPEPEQQIYYGVCDGYSSPAAAQAAAALQKLYPSLVKVEGELLVVSDAEIVLRNAAQQQHSLKVVTDASVFINGYAGQLSAACPVEDAPFYAVCLADLARGSVYLVDAVFLGFECDLLQIPGMEWTAAPPWPADARLTLRFDNGAVHQLQLWQACIVSVSSNALAHISTASFIPARVFILCTPEGHIRRIWL